MNYECDKCKKVFDEKKLIKFKTPTLIVYWERLYHNEIRIYCLNCYKTYNKINNAKD